MTNTIQNKIEEAKKRFSEKAIKLFTHPHGGLSVLLDYPPHDKVLDEKEVEKFLEQELSSIATLAQEEKEKEMIEKLTVKLDTKEMLNGWERYWAKVSDDRYVEDCMECENAKRILSTLSNTTLQ